MSYASDKKPGELTALTSLATDDVFVVGDTSDASEVAKGITKADLITDLGTSFAPALGADDNYVTDAEKAALPNKVTGPASATDNAIARYDGTTGKLVQNSGVTIDGSNNLTLPSASSIFTGRFQRPITTANAGGPILEVGAGKTFTTIQSAIDTIPYFIDDNYRIVIDPGTYNEDVLIPEYVAQWIKNTSSTESYPLQIKGDEADSSLVSVKSITSNGAHGSIPLIISNLTITGSSTYDNELAGISIYGGEAEIKDVVFASGSTGILSYGANCSVTNVDFGTSLTGQALKAKHGGEIWVSTYNAITNPTPITGNVGGNAYQVDQGLIFYPGTTGTLTSTGALHNPQNGFITDTENRVMYGVHGFSDSADALSIVPESLFDVSNERAWILANGGTDRTLRLLTTDNSAIRAEVELVNNNTGTGTINLKTDDTLRFTVLNGGNVGIGLDTPITKLHVTSTEDVAGAEVLRLESNRATPTANDEVRQSFYLSDSAGNQDEFARIAVRATDVTSTSEDSWIAFSNRAAGTLATRLILESGRLQPATNDSLALGSGSVSFSDIFLADGGVINFNNGNATLTHSAGLLTSNVDIATNITGNAATVTTNANLTGPVTSLGNATAIADGALSIAKTSGLQSALDAKVTGPASSTDNAIARFDSTTGKLLQNSTATLGDTGAIATTIANTSNVVGLAVTQNDTTNNPKAVTITNAGSGEALFIDQNGNGRSINIDSEATSAIGINAQFANTSGNVINWNNEGAQTAGQFFQIRQGNASTTVYAAEVENAGTGNGLLLDQNGNGIAINIDSEATTQPAIVADIVDGDAHIRLVGDSGNATPTEGDLWRESDGLKYYDGTKEHNLLLQAYTVATLPAGVVGARAYVTDATLPTYNGALTGGGAVVVPVFYNGTAWVSA